MKFDLYLEYDDPQLFQLSKSNFENSFPNKYKKSSDEKINFQVIHRISGISVNI